jgi:uncharacterized ParB-like nuclease family protein
MRAPLSHGAKGTHARRGIRSGSKLIQSLDMAQTPLESGGDSNHADATLSTMAAKEPDRSHDGDWEAALEAVEQLTVAVSRVGDAGALESA